MLFCICLNSHTSFCQNTFISDDNFEQTLIDLGYDTAPLDEFVLTSNINRITNLDYVGKDILDLTGIEDFLALTNLDCSDNLLDSLDTSNQLNLNVLVCEQNNISTLNLQNNDRLDVLICSFNGISNLDLSSNSNLTDLDCSSNQICSLNLKNGNNINFIPKYFTPNGDGS